MSKISYRADIDGLRAIAVLGVIFFHTQENILKGGFLGVDVFFVISGFLITSIIYSELESNSFSMFEFWKRRIKRILPAASLVILAVSILEVPFIFLPDLIQTMNQKLCALFSVGNYYFLYNTGDYWGLASKESPFLHYWSLAVEEQYYLVFPPILMLIYKYFRNQLRWIFVLGVLLSFVAFSVGVFFKPFLTFYMLPLRAWELGAGSLLAFYPHLFSRRGSFIRVLLGLFLLGLVYVVPFSSNGIGFESLLAVLSAMLIISAGPNQLSRFLLEYKPLVYVGKISFSLYLWHWPIVVFLRKIHSYQFPFSNIKLIILGIFLLLTLSLLSYYLVERRWRISMNGFKWALVLVISTFVYIKFIEPVLLRQMLFGEPIRSQFHIPSWYGKFYDVKPNGELGLPFQLISKCIYTPEREVGTDAYLHGGVLHLRSDSSPRVVVMGDSHAIMWSKLIDDLTLERNLSLSVWAMNGEKGPIYFPQAELPGKYLTLEELRNYDASRVQLIQQWNPDIVFFIIRWDFYVDGSSQEFFHFLSDHAKHVVLLEAPPFLNGIGNRGVFEYLTFLGRDIEASNNASIYWKDFDENMLNESKRKLERIVSQFPNFTLIPTRDLFLSKEGVKVAFGKEVFYLDDDHLTTEGSYLARERISAALDSMIAPK